MMQAPKFLYDNIMNTSTATLSASTSLTGYEVANITDWRTHTYWIGSSASTHTITIDMGTLSNADAIGICGHNLYSLGATVIVSKSTDGTSWVPLLTYAATADDVIFSTFAHSTASQYRLTINKPATQTEAPRIAVCAIGTALEFPHPPSAGASPINQTAVIKSNRSQTGILLGNVVKYHPVSLRMDFGFIGTTFYRTTSGAAAGYRSFWEDHGRYMLPFFVAFSGDTYPEAKYLMRLADGYDFTMPLYFDNLVQSLSVSLVSCQESST